MSLFKSFNVKNYTMEVIKNPTKYNLTDMVKPNSLITKIPNFFFNLIMPLIPSYIFILTKKIDDKK